MKKATPHSVRDFNERREVDVEITRNHNSTIDFDYDRMAPAIRQSLSPRKKKLPKLETAQVKDI